MNGSYLCGGLKDLDH